MPTPPAKPSTPWLMLVARPALFAGFQALIAIVLALFGTKNAWDASAGWWPFSVLFANLVTLFLLMRLFRAEGARYGDLWKFTRAGWWKDLLIVLVVFAISGVLSTLPNTWLATLLFGSADAAFGMFFRHLPFWALLIALVMPILNGMVELPTYFGYSMPRLAKQLNSGWWAWAIASFFLAFQHVAFPLIIDARFMAWRIGMFIPFAFFIGLVLKWRPRLFPYIMIGHALIDYSLIVILFTV